ncbi:hypothetical protein GBF38_018506, partial [Nibea albiflora]
MSSGNNNRMDQEPPQVSAERIQPLVELIVAQLTATHWAKVTSGSIDDETKAVITDMCVDFVNALCKIVLEEFENRLPRTKGKAEETTELIWEEDVQKYLGTSVADAFMAVAGRPMSRESAQRLSDLVSKEVTERVNSLPPVSEFKVTRRLQIIVKHVIGMLRHCRVKMPSCASRSRTVGSRSPDTAAERASPALQESLREQTPVSLFGSESRCSVGSFIETTTEAVKEILLEHVSDIELKSDAEISEEEHLRIVNSIHDDADETASDIAHYIWSNREEVG